VQLPAVFAKLNPREVITEITGGVNAGFPIISFRGKVWRVRKSGEEHNYVNADGDAMPSIEVVLVRSNPHLSKLYYEKGYEEGTNEAPRCWSADSIKPDAAVPSPISKACAVCPKNQWGSGRPTPSGGKTRACADSRRIAVAFRHELEERGSDATLFLLRIPAGSLMSLKEYAERTLAPRGIYPFATGTKIGFDAQVAHPKLTFRATTLLDEDEAAAVLALRESEIAHRILAEADELAAAGTTEEDGSGATDAETDSAPAAASAPKKAKPRPADEEEIEDAPPPPKPKKVVVEVEEEAEEAPPAPKAKPKKAEVEEEAEEAPPAPKAKPKKAVVEVEEEAEEAPPAPKAKPKKAVVEVEEEAEEAPPAPKAKPKKATAAPAADSDFDAMLDSILK
jgi:hypothetical protein